MAATEVEAGEGGGPVVRLSAPDEEEEVDHRQHDRYHHHHHHRHHHQHHRCHQLNHPGPPQALWLQTPLWL